MIRKLQALITDITNTTKCSDRGIWVIVFGTGLLTSIIYIVALTLEILRGFGDTASKAMLAGAVLMMIVNVRMLMTLDD